MKTLGMAALTAILLLSSEASAQFVYVNSPPVFFAGPRAISPALSYSYYPSAPVAFATSPIVTSSTGTVIVRSAPTVVVPQTAVAVMPSLAVPSYGVYGARTTYGLGVLRPRGLNTQYYYSPYFIR